ncbi:MAG: alkaline phosphatase [Clostridiales bacterium]|nr:alkaline phosphatase [Clostridiales bacterium]
MKRNVFSKISAVLVVVLTLLFAFGCAQSSSTTSDPEPDPPQLKYGEIKNIVLIIGDGMGIEHVSAGQIYEGKQYGFSSWKYTSVNTDSVDTIGKSFITTDSAAGGTALATGQLTVNGYVGKEWHGRDVETILDRAKAKGKATGVLTTDNLYGATPASFSAHALSRNDTEDILNSQLTSGVDLLCGSTASACTDKADNIAENGYTLCTDFEEIENAKTAEKAYWQFDMWGYNSDVKLEEVTPHALEYLSKDEDGFVIMIEQAHIDKYSHDNDIEGMVKSVASLNNTVEAVLEWVGDRKDTAILITADHETGGLTVSTSSQSHSDIATLDNKKLYYDWESGGHTDSKVPLFVYGINPDYSWFGYYKSHHLIKNVNVYHIMANLLNNGLRYAT